MPCRSDYLEQTGLERGLQQTAVLLEYTIEQLRERTDNPTLLDGSAALDPKGREYYAEDVGQVEMLCTLLTAMSEEHREAIVYDAHSVKSRQLATWWEEHQKADRIREELEEAALRKEALRASARAKLTPEERAAVGLS